MVDEMVIYLEDEMPALDDAQPSSQAIRPTSWYVRDIDGPWHLSTRLNQEDAKWGTVVCERKPKNVARYWDQVDAQRPILHDDMCEDCDRVNA